MKTSIIILMLLLSACSIRIYKIEYHMRDDNIVRFEASVDATVPRHIDTAVDAAADVEASVLPKH